MAPIPSEWHQPLAISLQRLVSQLSVVALSAVEIPVYHVGYLLFLPGHTLEVAEACSGTRQSSMFLALSVVVASQFNRTWTTRILLVLLALPIAVAANCIRIVLTALVYVYLGAESLAIVRAYNATSKADPTVTLVCKEVSIVYDCETRTVLG